MLSRIRKVARSDNFSDLLWTVVGAALGRLGALISSMWVAREIGQAAFGYYGLFYVNLMFSLVLVNSGGCLVATREISARLIGPRESLPSAIKGIYIYCGVSGGAMMVLMIVVAAAYGSEIYQDDRAINVMNYSALGLLFAAWSAAHSAILNGVGEFKTSAKTNLTGAALGFILAPVGALINMDAALVGLVASLMIQSLIGHVVVRKVLKRRVIPQVSLRAALGDCRFYLTKGFPVAVSGLAVSAATWIVTTWVERGADLGGLAIFNISNQWRSALLFIPITLGPMIVAKLSHRRELRQESNGANKIIIIWTAVVGLVSYGVIWVGSPYIMAAYGREFESGRADFVILLAASMIVVVNNVQSKILASAGAYRIISFLDYVWVVVYIGALLLRSNVGLQEVAESAILAAVIQFAFQFLALKKLRLLHE